jgi:hypothetical protein
MQFPQEVRDREHLDLAEAVAPGAAIDADLAFDLDAAVAAMSRMARSHCRFHCTACFTSMHTTRGLAPGWRLRVSITKSISAPLPV